MKKTTMTEYLNVHTLMLNLSGIALVIIEDTLTPLSK